LVNIIKEPNKDNLPSGLKVEKIKNINDQIETIAEYDDYSYYLINLKNKINFKLEGLASTCAFIPDTNNNLNSITANGKIIQKGSCILLNNIDLEITNKDGEGFILIAGTKKINENKEKTINVNDKKAHYTVDKPWGHELWINHGQTNYSFKEVYIKENYQTSLQYHEFKKETAILYDGECEIIFKNDQNIHNDDVTAENLAKVIIEPINIIDVKTLVLHRIKAISNMYHYEVSTPFLDDVIRVNDDSNRKNGRIQKEHNT